MRSLTAQPARLTRALRSVVVRVPESARVLIGGLLLVGLMGGLFALIQFAAPGLTGNDGYYHMKMALLIRQRGLKPLFIWLPMSILSPAAFYDHHFLYHVYLALFVPARLANATPDALTLGGKLASVVMPTLAFAAIWWLLRGQAVRRAWLWALGLFAVSDAFLFRLSMPRAQSASLLVLAVGLHLLLKRRHAWLIPLGFAYVWLYNAFPLLIVLAAAYVAAAWLIERAVEWRALAAVAVGIGLGLLVNPYFPQDITFILDHVLPKLGDVGSRVGNEWYPYQTWTLVENSSGALIALAAGALALAWHDERIDLPTLVALLLMLAFGLMALKARRFVEYFPAFALIFAALALSRLTDRLASRRASALLVAGLVVALGLLGTRSVLRARNAMTQAKPADLYAEAATWLAENSPSGSLVFQTDWDDFPRLFFYNTSNVYTIGLDVTYMQLYSARLYDEWVSITRGRVEAPGEVIASHFGASYVFSDLEHEDFLRQAEDDPRLTEVYRGGDAVIFEVAE